MKAGTHIAILGAGAWGTALGCAMARTGRNAIVWGRSEQAIKEINDDKRNTNYLGDIKLEQGLRATTSLREALSDAVMIMLATPAQSVLAMTKTLDGLVGRSQAVIACSKGIDRQTGRTPAATLANIMGTERIGVLSGPGFASDVARGLPTAVTIAFDKMTQAKQCAQLLSSENFRIYASDDPVGVELGGALKNVLAIAVGAARGMELGASAEAALIARGFSELSRLAGKMGARLETLQGLSGLGDLALTASSTQSRNFSCGIALGRAESIDGMPLAEGVFTARIAGKLARKYGVDAPVIQSVEDVLANRLTARQAVRQLLARPLKAESE